MNYTLANRSGNPASVFIPSEWVKNLAFMAEKNDSLW